MSSEFKDLFSGHAADYAKFRPTYPLELFKYLSSLTKSHQLAWDCGTGNGQAAIELAKLYERVVATDPSEKQIQSATKNPNIHYSVGSASSVPQLKNQSVDLITVAQAFHWFNQAEFFNEVKRVGKPGAVLAFWCYGMMKITPEIDQAVLRLYEEVLGPYWEKERKLVDENYQNVSVPFEEVKGAPVFNMNVQWNFEQMIGYLNTWSALQKYQQQNSKNPIEFVYKDLQKSWGPEKGTRPVHWQIGLRLSKV